VNTDACVRLARTWRNNRDVRDSYVTVANKVEQVPQPTSIAGGAAQGKRNLLARREDFSVHVENELIEATTPGSLQLAEYRLSRFWADVNTLGGRPQCRSPSAGEWN